MILEQQKVFWFDYLITSFLTLSISALVKVELITCAMLSFREFPRKKST